MNFSHQSSLVPYEKIWKDMKVIKIFTWGFIRTKSDRCRYRSLPLPLVSVLFSCLKRQKQLLIFNFENYCEPNGLSIVRGFCDANVMAIIRNHLNRSSRSCEPSGYFIDESRSRFRPQQSDFEKLLQWIVVIKLLSYSWQNIFRATICQGRPDIGRFATIFVLVVY